MRICIYIYICICRLYRLYSLYRLYKGKHKNKPREVQVPLLLPSLLLTVLLGQKPRHRSEYCPGSQHSVSSRLLTLFASFTPQLHPFNAKVADSISHGLTPWMMTRWWHVQTLDGQDATRSIFLNCFHLARWEKTPFQSKDLSQINLNHLAAFHSRQ